MVSMLIPVNKRLSEKLIKIILKMGIIYKIIRPQIVNNRKIIE